MNERPTLAEWQWSPEIQRRLRRWHFECPECEYDDKEHGRLLTDQQEHCPLCWLDCGHVVAVRKWLA